MAPLVSVVVVTKNEEKHIGACLRSLRGQDFPRGLYEILVVDAASTDRTAEIARQHARLVVDGYGTLGHQRNTGVKQAAGSYVAFTDADCVAHPQWLSRLVAALEASPPEVAVVGGPNLVMPQDPLFSRVVGHMQETLLGSGGSPQSYHIEALQDNVISVANCNALYRREMLLRTPYEDSLRMSEDAELNYRLRRHGYRIVFLPQAIVWHHRVASLSRFVAKMFDYGKAIGGVTRMHRRVIRWYAPLPSLALLAWLMAYPLLLAWPWLGWAYGVAFLVYVIALLVSAAHVGRRAGAAAFALALALLPIQHLAYACGFVKGALLRS